MTACVLLPVCLASLGFYFQTLHVDVSYWRQRLFHVRDLRDHARSVDETVLHDRFHGDRDQHRENCFVEKHFHSGAKSSSFCQRLTPLETLLISSMTTVNHPAITELPPAATVKQITLDDGQQASVVIQGGRITKILAANGQVAELSWKDDAASSTNWRVKYHHLPPSEQ